MFPLPPNEAAVIGEIFRLFPGTHEVTERDSRGVAQEPGAASNSSPQSAWLETRRTETAGAMAPPAGPTDVDCKSVDESRSVTSQASLFDYAPRRAA